ncbi:MAG: hypothetical protein ACOVRB_10275 [Akkermansiaceae bacterium]
MSRRSQRKARATKNHSKSPAWGRWILRLTLCAMIVAAVGSVAGYMWLRSYLSGADFRKMILTQAEKSLRAESNMSPLRWDGFQVNTDFFEANGASAMKQVTVEGIKTGIDAGGVIRGVWSVSPSRITKLSATWDTTASEAAEPSERKTSDSTLPAPTSKAWYDAWIPKSIETDTWVINDSSFRLITKQGDIIWTGTRWDLEPTHTFEKCKLRANGGKIKTPFAWAPEIKLDKMRLTYQKDYLYLTDATCRLYQNGHLDLGGELSLVDRSYSLEGSMRDVMCHEVLPADWRQRLTGKVESSFTVRSGSDLPTIKGHMQIDQGMLTALPILDKLAAYSQSLRFRTLTLHDAECDYEWSGNYIVLTNVKIGSEGLARMEGKITFSRSGPELPYQLNGDFRVGLAPGTLAQIPGAEEDVFQPGERGLLWAPMHVSGTMADPKEDLSERLMAAAGARMFEIIPATGVKVLKYTQQVVEDVSSGNGVVNQAVDVGGKVLETGTEAVDQAVQGTKGVVDGVLGIFGSGRKNEQPPDPFEAEKGSTQSKPKP